MTVAMFQKGKEFVWEGIELVMKAVTEAEVEAHKALGWVLHPYDTIEVPAVEPAAPAAADVHPVETPPADAAPPAKNPFA